MQSDTSNALPDADADAATDERSRPPIIKPSHTRYSSVIVCGWDDAEDDAERRAVEKMRAEIRAIMRPTLKRTSTVAALARSDAVSVLVEAYHEAEDGGTSAPPAPPARRDPVADAIAGHYDLVRLLKGVSQDRKQPVGAWFEIEHHTPRVIIRIQTRHVSDRPTMHKALEMVQHAIAPLGYVTTFKDEWMRPNEAQTRHARGWSGSLRAVRISPARGVSM